MHSRRSLLIGTGAAGLGLLGSGLIIPTAQAALTGTDRFPVLKQGANNSNVKLVQARLGIAADGVFGAGTKSAVITFQRSKGLTADGVIGAKTWAQLLDILKSGSKGNLVKGLQLKLGIGADGVFGAGTLASVKSFQSRNGLVADGVVGAATWGKLVGASSTTTPPPSGKNPKTLYQNGRLPASALAWVGFGRSTWRMSTYCIADFKRLNTAFKAQFGINLPITNGDMTTYRTYDQQVYLWNLYQSGKGNKAARPGTSNHGWGLAADISVGGYGSRQYNWLNANAGRFGFNDDVSGESWHWGYQR